MLGVHILDPLQPLQTDIIDLLINIIKSDALQRNNRFDNKYKQKVKDNKINKRIFLPLFTVKMFTFKNGENVRNLLFRQNNFVAGFLLH